MAQTVREVMTTNLVTCDASATIADVAALMRDRDIGDVLVEADGKLRGIVTDRDIVVRCVAEGRDGNATSVVAACSSDLTAITPDTELDRAIAIMRDRAIRRLPVVEDGHAIGVVSIGDLAIERDAGDALADISTASPNG